MSEPTPPGPPPRARPKFSPLPKWVGPSTRAVHAGGREDSNAGAVVFPIYQTSTFRYPAEFSESRSSGDVHLYTRLDNPTQEVAAELLRSLEGAEAARVFGSGMAAISATLLTFLSPGDEVVALEDLYGGTLDLLTELLPRFGVRVRFLNAAEADRPEEAIRPGTRLVYFESPTNPLLRVHDIRRWAGAARAVGAISVFDNTFGTPVAQSPLALGVDLVVHSASKYLGGHSDVIAGAVAGPAELLRRIDRTSGTLGAPLDPFAAFLLTRGMKTLPMRVARQSETARRLVDALDGHPAVAALFYPGRDRPESEAIAAAQMRERGGIVGIELEGGRAAAKRFLGALRLIHAAASLGGVESLASVPAETSHRGLTDAACASRGIRPGLVRLSVGLEEADDLIRDISEALDVARRASEPPVL
jgi:cystathionine beta-lyase/cystathionine gamma-synthase